jgi:hypothetical protein
VVRSVVLRRQVLASDMVFLCPLRYMEHVRRYQHMALEPNADQNDEELQIRTFSQILPLVLISAITFSAVDVFRGKNGRYF